MEKQLVNIYVLTQKEVFIYTCTYRHTSINLHIVYASYIFMIFKNKPREKRKEMI